MAGNQEANGSRLDRIERALDRLVANQADQHIAHQNISAIVDRVVTVVETLAGSFVQIADAQRLADEKIAGLAQRMDELAQRMDELAQAQKHSDERVDRVIDVVEHVIRRQGPPPPVQ